MGFVFVFWLISLSMRFSSSIHVAANGIMSLFFMAEEYFMVYIYHIFRIQSSVDGPFNQMSTPNIIFITKFNSPLKNAIQQDLL